LRKKYKEEINFHYLRLCLGFDRLILNPFCQKNLKKIFFGLTVIDLINGKYGNYFIYLSVFLDSAEREFRDEKEQINYIKSILKKIRTYFKN
jgi:hypothetical protein